MAFIAGQLVYQTVRKNTGRGDWVWLFSGICLSGWKKFVKTSFLGLAFCSQRFNFTISGNSSDIRQLSFNLETTIQCLEGKVSQLGSLLFQALLKIFYLSLTKKTTTTLLKKSRPLSNYLRCRAFIIRRFQTCTEILILILIRE